MSATYRVLRWKSLARWTTEPTVGDAQKGFVPLSSILVEKKRLGPADLRRDQASPISVHFDGSITPRARVELYKGRMFLAEPGDIVFSKIDVRNGAIGVVPASIGRAVVTPEFPVLAPMLGLADPTFITALARTDEFRRELHAVATGTSGRQRVDPQVLLSVLIPDLALTEQQAIVRKHADAIAAAEEIEAQAASSLAEADRDFAAAIGAGDEVGGQAARMLVTALSALDRWGYEFLPQGPRTPTAHPYPMRPLGQLITDLENGWSPKCLARSAAPSEWGVLKLGAVSFGWFDGEQNKALPPNLLPRPRLEVRPGDLLISRANVTRLVGAAAIATNPRGRLMLCDKIFRAIPKEPAAVDPQYLVRALRTPALRRQIEHRITGTSPSMKNISKAALLKLLIPLPDLPRQRALVDQHAAAQERARGLLERSRVARLRAWAEFQAEAWVMSH
jgi:type I restriction enzyme S subunit